MYGFFYRFGTWLLQKVGAAVLIVVLGLVGVGVWLYAQDQVDVETRRIEYIAQLEVARVQLEAVQGEAVQLVDSLKVSVAEQEARVAAATSVISRLRALESWWDRLWGNAEQQRSNADQITRLENLKRGAGSTIQSLSRELETATSKAADIDFRLGSLRKEIESSRNSESAVAHYLRTAWVRSRVYIGLALIGFFFGPTVIKLLAFFVLAPLLARGKSIHFEGELQAMPNVRPSAVSTDVGLWPGEVLRVKEKFLQSSDERVSRKTCFVFDWAIPLTSVACGLIELVEMRNRQAGDRAAVTLSNSDDPHVELAVIEVPEGGSLILRPSFLIGVITQNEEKVKIRRRWALLRWQAWITLQFRFFEFVGPCRLVVAGGRGVRAEVLTAQEGITRPARRTNQRATIGFTPNLDYLPVRAETFWGYYRNMNPLFDDLFAGTGLFVLQETSTNRDGVGPPRFWATVWSGILKIFGI